MLYRYIGPREIANRCGQTVREVPVTSATDVARWIRSIGELVREASEVTVTFVVNEEGTLLVADRHSEHVACAGGRPVRAAGEMCFALGADRAAVTRVSNQSTGYCPEPESWVEVATALRSAGLDLPEGFEPRCEFRRCEKCSSINIVKSGVFECGVRGRIASRVQRAEAE